MASKKGLVAAVLNMKGGVGKTTISAHVMRVLYHRLAKKTLLIDLDPQFNLTQGLMTRSQYDKVKAAGRTIFAAMEPPPSVGLFDVSDSKAPPPKVADLISGLRNFTGGSPPSLDLVAGDFSLVKYSLIRDSTKLGLVEERSFEVHS